MRKLEESQTTLVTDADEVQRQIDQFCEQQIKLIESKMDYPTYFRPLFDRNNYRLKKLPMWGQKISLNNISFQWPEKGKPHISPDEYLKSIVFESCKEGKCLMSVKCNLAGKGP